jgi:hypothetical protein
VPSRLLTVASKEVGLRILIEQKMSREKIDQSLRDALEEVDFPELTIPDREQEIQGLMRQ